MSGTLYNMDILRLAANIPHLKRLERPQATVERRSPTCGSRVLVDVVLGEDGRICDLGWEVNACALGQASASLLSAHAPGHSAQEIAQARDALAAALSGQGDFGFWPGMEVLAAARDYPARHPSIRLAFEVLAEAAVSAGREQAA